MKAKVRAKRKLIALITVMLMVIMTVMPVSAASTYGDGVAAQNVEFNKILIVKQGDDIPDVSFDYTVSVPSAKIDAVPDVTLEVLPGVGTPTVSTVTYSKTADTKDATSKVTGYDTITKTVTVDFTGIKFNEPGVYRYYIQEKDDQVPGVVYDVDATSITTQGDRYRTLDVYVEDDTTTSLGLKITGYVMYDGQVADAPAVPGTTETAASGAAITSTVTVTDLKGDSQGASRITGATKTDNIMNYFDAYNVTISKTVEGNQGSKDKYFEFTFEVNGLSAGTKYIVDISNAEANPTATPATTVTVAANPTTVTADASGAISQKFYLQHGQSIIIRGLARDTKYTVSENKEDYKASIVATEDVVDNSVTIANTGDSATDSGIVGNTALAFTNTRDGIIPTGILLSATPWIIVGVVVVAGLAFFAIRSRRKYDEE